MRFFWILKNSLKGVLAKNLIWTGPLLCPKISHNPKRHMYYKKQKDSPNLKVRSKRSVSLFPYLKGSITIETALSLPLFLFFCIQIISVINILQLHSAITAALHQEVSRLSLQAYAYEKASIDVEEFFVNMLEDNVLKEQVINRIGREYLNRSMIEGGSQGISIVPLGETGLYNQHKQEEIEVVLTYRIKPIINILGFSGFSMANTCCMKAWTGYQLSQSESGEADLSEELVYITENGVVYHKSRRCSYLNLSVREASMDSLAVLRNDNGEKYYACEYCAQKAGEQIFLTDQGKRYHSSLVCSGLKRTIYVVKLSEVGGRGACSRCVGNG